MKKTFYIIAFITMTFLCNAQTSYVYVNPDSCVCVTSTYNTADTLITNWDLDKDGTNDFQIVVESYMSDCMHGFELTSLNALGNNKIAGDSLCTNSCNYAFMLNAGDTISKQPSWLSSSTLEYFNEFSGWYGHWKDSLFPNTIKFAGIKFYSGATLYYGWLRLNVVATCELARVLVIDYAYSTSPDSCLICPRH